MTSARHRPQLVATAHRRLRVAGGVHHRHGQTALATVEHPRHTRLMARPRRVVAVATIPLRRPVEAMATLMTVRPVEAVVVAVEAVEAAAVGQTAADQQMKPTHGAAASARAARLVAAATAQPPAAHRHVVLATMTGTGGAEGTTRGSARRHVVVGTTDAT